MDYNITRIFLLQIKEGPDATPTIGQDVYPLQNFQVCPSPTLVNGNTIHKHARLLVYQRVYAKPSAHLFQGEATGLTADDPLTSFSLSAGV